LRDALGKPAPTSSTDAYLRIFTMPVSVSTSMAQMCVPWGKEKFTGSKVASASIDGSMPSGKLCAAKVASAISWMDSPVPGVPRTEKVPPENSRSSSLASSRWAATRRAFATTLSAAFTTAAPPTTSEREP
jgi:hypothetical protein